MRKLASSSSSSASTRRRSSTPCCIKVGIKRGPWTAEEDELLVNYIKREGEGRWRTLPSRAGLQRYGKSCRLRWMNYLRSSVKRGCIASDEEDLILRLHRLLSNRWSLIAGRIPGRTDNEIKNYWNTHLNKKLISQGIDPRTHNPLNINNPNPPYSNFIHHNIIPQQNPNYSLLQIHGLIVTDCITDQVTPTKTLERSSISNIIESHDDKALHNGIVDDHHDLIMELPSDHGQNNIEEDYMIKNLNDDLFSSFLDSLVNDNVTIGS